MNDTINVLWARLRARAGAMPPNPAAGNEDAMDPLIVWLVAITSLAVISLWLLFFPDARSALWQRVRRVGDVIGRAGGHAAQRAAGRLHTNSRQAGSGAAHFWRTLARNRLLIAIILVALLAPAALVLGLRQRVILQGYGTATTLDPGTAALVASLLRGEHLVPPPPLPPAVFVTKEVEQETPHLHLGRANRDWNELNPDFRQRLLAVFKVMRDRYGYDMVMIEGYRSPQRQAELAAEGASVTQAGPGQSYHQYGLAADCAFYRDGKLVISDRSAWVKQGYKLYGEVAEAAGLVWGGSWKNLRDLGHVELHVPGIGPPRRG